MVPDAEWSPAKIAKSRATPACDGNPCHHAATRSAAIDGGVEVVPADATTVPVAMSVTRTAAGAGRATRGPSRSPGGPFNGVFRCRKSARVGPLE